MPLPSTPRPSRTRPLDRERLRITTPTSTSPPAIEPLIRTPPASATRLLVLKRLIAIPLALERSFSTQLAVVISHWVPRLALISQRARTILISPTKAFPETPAPSESARMDFRQKPLWLASLGQLLRAHKLV